MKKYILPIVLAFLLFPFLAHAATYTILNATTTFDGSSDCAGACTSSDIIEIEGGARGTLVLTNIDGDGSYITIRNDNADRVVITGGGSGDGNGALAIHNCAHIDLRGDNLGGTTYGIKVINDVDRSGTVWIKGTADHIKLSYLEVTCEGSTGAAATGIFLQDSSLSDATVWDTFEFHHNYVHDTRYHGMYIGHNAWLDNPWTINVKVYDNILEDTGGNGFVVKGIHATSGTTLIYNNVVDNTGLHTIATDEWKSGIRWRPFTAAAASIYDNTVYNTIGAGIATGKGPAAIYNNILANNGTGDNADWGNGIVAYLGADGTTIYDNIIIQPTRYGFYNKAAAANGVTLSRNLIGDAGIGEWSEADPGDTVESGSPNQNIYHADVADFAFNTWSDDSDYSNDLFRSRALVPVSGGTGVSQTIDLTWVNSEDVTTIDLYFDKTTNPPTTLVVDDGAVETYDCGSLDLDGVYYWKIISTYPGGTETGAVYSFTVTSGPPPPAASKGGVVYNDAGGVGIYAPSGTVVK